MPEMPYGYTGWKDLPFVRLLKWDSAGGDLRDTNDRWLMERAQLANRINRFPKWTNGAKMMIDIYFLRKLNP